MVLCFCWFGCCSRCLNVCVCFACCFMFDGLLCLFVYVCCVGGLIDCCLVYVVVLFVVVVILCF